MEFCALMHYERDPNIIFIDTQPHSINYIIDDLARDYTSDFLLMDVQSELEYVESKYSEDLEKPKNKKKYKAIKREFRKLDRKFSTFTEKMLTDVQINNLSALFQGASTFRLIDVDVFQPLKFLKDSMTVKDALQTLRTNNLNPSLLHYLLFNHYYRVDLTEEIGSHSLVYRNVE